MRCGKFGVVLFKASMLNCRGAICNGYMFIVLYIYVTYLVYLFSRDLFLIGGGGGVNLPLVYVHCANLPSVV